MCTLSFIPTEKGYHAAMNRDERFTRGPGLPPELFRMGNLWAAYPHEADGGTWIASNEQGITLALLNWNLEEGPAHSSKQCSRGSVIPKLIRHGNLADTARAMDSLSLYGILPFRLAGIFWAERQVCEWRWDGLSLKRFAFPWQPRHWFSSGLSDEVAERSRGEACRIAWQDPFAGTLSWLRELHRSHASQPGAFTMCAHRPDAGTVSYSEVEFDRGELTLRYTGGAPCENNEMLTLRVPLAEHLAVA